MKGPPPTILLLSNAGILRDRVPASLWPDPLITDSAYAELELQTLAFASLEGLTRRRRPVSSQDAITRAYWGIE